MPESIAYGGVTVTISVRKNGFYKIYWREAKKERSTTRVKLSDAREFARKKAREVAGSSGGRMVSVIEAEAIQALKKVIGARSLSGAVEQLGDAVRRLGGWDHVQRAFEGYVKAGHGRLDRAPAREAVPRFLALFRKPENKEYAKGLKKELQVFADRHADLSIADIDEALLRAWIGRANEDGSEPGWRYFNNRLATWKTFLNRCRQWGMRLKDEEHPGETIQPMRKVDKVPPIWEVEQARKILQVVRLELNESLTYLVTGCWMGLRPFEMHRVVPGKWDWERGYLQVDADVARKVMSERFVPIPPNVRELLYERLSAPEAFWGSGLGRRPARHIVRSDDQMFISRLLRDKKLIKGWPQDVMRHSYISYRLAQGNGRGQVAEWAGNSEREIRKSYRRPLMKEEGDQWFAIGLA